jgi:hypothetical protein
MAEGDPRGELIVLQHDADEADGARKTALRRATNAHLAKHATELLGPLAGLGKDRCRMLWRYGFVRRLELSWKTGYWPDSTHALEDITNVLRHPSYQFVLELLVAPIFDEGYECQYQAVFDLLADLGKPQTLRVLDVGVASMGREDTWSSEVSHLVAALPKLRRIRLRAQHGENPKPTDPLQEMMIKRSRS